MARARCEARRGARDSGAAVKAGLERGRGIWGRGRGWAVGSLAPGRPKGRGGWGEGVVGGGLSGGHRLGQLCRELVTGPSTRARPPGPVGPSPQLCLHP